MDKERWLEVLRRADLEGHLPDGMTIELFSDGHGLHGDAGCIGVRERVTVAAEDIFDRPDAHWCSDCGGWRSSRFGQLAISLDRIYQAIDDEQSGKLDSTWKDISERLGVADRELPGVRVSDDLLLAERARARKSHLTVARRSAARLDRTDLLRAMAAQDLHANVAAGEADILHSWAQRRRINSTQTPRDWAEHHAYDEALAIELSRPGTTLVAVRRNQAYREEVIDSGIPPELALLLWLDGHAEARRQVAFLHLPLIAAAGLRRLSAHNARVAVAGSDEHDQDVLATVAVLWADMADELTTQSHVLLDSLLETARTL